MGGLGGGGLPLGGILAMAGRFGWKGILIAILLIGFMTYSGMCGGASMCSGLTGGGQQPAATQQQQPASSATEDELKQFVGFVLDDIQDTWSKDLRNYERTKLVLFRGAVASACGTASSAVGPFYCPVDRKVYVDLDFYDELRRKFGAPGDFAQAYVIAHEVGHHIQNINGLMGRGDVDSIPTELQADCLAGAWGKSAQQRKLLEVGDIDEALNAARQIGDDSIQQRTRGRIQPETWTHGSAEQRKANFEKGLRGGPEACGLR